MIDLSQHFGSINVGRSFGTRIVIGPAPSRNGYLRCLMRCRCGTESEAEVNELRKGKALCCKSCPSVKEELIGRKFGRLLVTAYAGRQDGRVTWLVKCECGQERQVRGNNLKSGQTKSCGCLKIETSRTLASRLLVTHGKTKTPEYNVWNAMWARCTNPNAIGFDRYGEKGIVVCEEWGSFERFFADMGTRPSPRHELDRINSLGNYEPGNCRWATKWEQSANRSNVKRRTTGRKILTMPDWKFTYAREYEVKDYESCGWLTVSFLCTKLGWKCYLLKWCCACRSAEPFEARPPTVEVLQ